MDLSKIASQAQGVVSKAQGMASEAKEKFKDVQSKVEAAAGDVKSQVADVKKKAAEAVNGVKSQVDRVKSQVSQMGNDAKSQMEDAVGDVPNKFTDKGDLGDAVSNLSTGLSNNLPPGLPGGLPGMTGMLGTNDNSDSDDSNGPAQSYEMDEDEKKKIETRINDFEQKMKEEFTLKLNNYFKQENNKKFGEVKEETHRFIDKYFSGIIKKDEEDQIKEALINVIKNNLENPNFKNKEEKEEEEEKESLIKIIIDDSDKVPNEKLIKPIK